jgi:hypothetical protein
MQFSKDIRKYKSRIWKNLLEMRNLHARGAQILRVDFSQVWKR